MNRNRAGRFFLPLLVVLLLPVAILAAGINTTDPSLPPLSGSYKTATNVHATYSGPGLLVVLSDISHKPLAVQLRMTMGADEQETFDSLLRGMATVNGVGPSPFEAMGLSITKVYGKTGNITGTFPTEVLQMNLQGVAPFSSVMIRESPTLATNGSTKITDLGSGLYHIDSFFDVFTELSVDGGATWIPSQGSTRVVLSPEPGTVVGVCLAGLMGVILLRPRR